MKKNRMMRLASVLLVLCLLTTSVISGTFAKYTSSNTATATATVAKWDVKLDDKAFTDSITFDFTEAWTDSDGSAETDVVSKKLAPGTKGSFDLKVTNSSEVNAQFKIDFDLTALAGLPLEFTYKVGEETYTDNSFVAIAMNETKTVTVTWEWPFYEDATQDTADTTLGITAATFNITAAVTVEQVD